MSDAGGANGIVGGNLVLDDEAANQLPDATALSSGSWRPANWPTASDAFPAPAPAQSANVNLSTFDGLAANGTWTFCLQDDAALDMGDITSWSLSITTSGGPTTSATTAATSATSATSATTSATATTTSASATTATTTASAATTATASATTATASASASTSGSLPRAAGDRAQARQREAADPQGQLLRRPRPPRSHQAIAARPRHRAEPEARRRPASRLPGQPAGGPRVSQ